MTLPWKTLNILSILFSFQIIGSAYSNAQTGRRIYLQSNTAGLEIIYGAKNTVENCSIGTNESPVNQSYAANLPTSFIPVSETFIAHVTESCKVFQHHLKGALKPRRKRFIIYPGTKWCGIGNRAKHYLDFGRHTFTDSCCRAHDACPISINPFNTLMGMTNIGLFSILDCDCEANFYYCLKSVQEPAATEIGDIYFNAFRPDCIHFAPSLVCLSRSKLTGQCVFTYPQLDVPRIPTFIPNPFVF
ncbi:hypothetical protein CHS0354_036373 [Potamilus streckersoni]|uniref:Phospholipase A2-like central domain-containing protein n=1 Tax=Potamilus streckersoni TaxID=2493646 RepID=A0AAE0SRQ3_9BIVA|nr:hypothetical protein CHS0354_036373 [Potamilus streckersoni]